MQPEPESHPDADGGNSFKQIQQRVLRDLTTRKAAVSAYSARDNVLHLPRAI